MKRLEKVSILEKDFPGEIPEDIGSKPLEVVNEQGETVALFYNIEFMRHKPKELKEFIKYHDGIFHLFQYWEALNFRGRTYAETEDEEEEVIRQAEKEMEKSPDYNWIQFWEADSYHEFESMPAICRLTYPYYLENFDEVMEPILITSSFIEEWEFVLELADFNVYKKVLELTELSESIWGGSWEGGFEMVVEHFPEWIYEHPDYWFTRYKPEYMIDKVAKSAHVELMAFLLDYKNKHFPYDEKANLEIDDVPEDGMRQIFRKLKKDITS